MMKISIILKEYGWIGLFILIIGCQNQNRLSFQKRTISTDGEFWWARALADINDDGLLDFVVQHNNAHGGWLGWYEANDRTEKWEQHIIAQTPPDGNTFACGDLEVGDMDNDGDIDILGFAHEGEWDNSAAPTRIYWYENPDWQIHEIGTVSNFIKNLNVVDLNGDTKRDLVTITYETDHEFSVFRQDNPDAWSEVQTFSIWNLHEGMDVGDIDGDGDPDVAANGYWIKNPGGDLTATWEVMTIDSMWFNQIGDWSKNATDVFCRDITGDGRVEVFICHSEREGYPVVWYELIDINNNQWTKHIIGTVDAAQTLDVYDLDLDGDFDVMAGENGGRWTDEPEDPVILFLNQGNNDTWMEFLLTSEGIYNGLIGDFECDGDLDIWRMSGHDASDFELCINQIKK